CRDTDVSATASRGAATLSRAPRADPRQARPGTALAGSSPMLPVLASMVDFVHALFMAVWVLGLPLLFWRRFPRATWWYAVYAVTFIVLSQGSRIWLGECFLTT